MTSPYGAGWPSFDIQSFSATFINGTNSIAAYMLATCVNFSSVSGSLLFGLKAYIGDFYPALIAIANAVIIYQILRVMYRQQVFLKV